MLSAPLIAIHLRPAPSYRQVPIIELSIHGDSSRRRESPTDPIGDAMPLSRILGVSPEEPAVVACVSVVFDFSPIFARCHHSIAWLVLVREPQLHQ